MIKKKNTRSIENLLYVKFIKKIFKNGKKYRSYKYYKDFWIFLKILKRALKKKEKKSSIKNSLLINKDNLSLIRFPLSINIKFKRLKKKRVKIFVYKILDAKSKIYEILKIWKLFLRKTRIRTYKFRLYYLLISFFLKRHFMMGLYSKSVLISNFAEKKFRFFKKKKSFRKARKHKKRKYMSKYFGILMFFFVVFIIMMFFLKKNYKPRAYLKRNAVKPILWVLDEVWFLIFKKYFNRIKNIVLFYLFFKKKNELRGYIIKDMIFSSNYYVKMVYSVYEKVKTFFKNSKFFFKLGHKKSFYYKLIVKKNKRNLSWYFK